MEILNNLLEKRQNEETTASDITYLPSTLGAVQGAITSLAKKKKEWDIEILEDEASDSRIVVIEDALRIKVPVMWWAEFSDLFGGNLYCGKLRLGNYLMEAMEDKHAKIVDQIKPALTLLYESKVFDKLDKAVLLWNSWFKPSKLLRPDVPVAVESKYKDIQRVSSKLKRLYRGDLGNLELLVEACREQQPLNSFEVFKEHDYIYGSRAVSVYEGTPMTFEATLDTSYLMAQSIAVENEDVALEFDDMSGVKVVRNVLFPLGGSFTNEVFRRLKEELENANT